jgi:hypothetical protein
MFEKKCAKGTSILVDKKIKGRKMGAVADDKAILGRSMLCQEFLEKRDKVGCFQGFWVP